MVTTQHQQPVKVDRTPDYEPLRVRHDRPGTVTALPRIARFNSCYLVHEVPEFCKVEIENPNDGEPSYCLQRYQRFENLQLEWKLFVKALAESGGTAAIVEGTGRAFGPSCTAVQDLGIVLHDLNNPENLPACIVQGRFSPVRSWRDYEVDRVTRVFELLSKVVKTPPGAYLEGGDIVLVGRMAFVREPDDYSRINQAGIEFFKQVAEPLGYTVIPVTVIGKDLHLTHVCTWAGSASLDGRPCIAVNSRNLKDVSLFKRLGFDVVDVNGIDLFHAANVLSVNDQVILQAGSDKLLDRFLEAGYARHRLVPVPWREMSRIDIGFTCCTITL